MTVPAEASASPQACDSQMATAETFDCIVQIQSKSLAERLVLYHQDPEVRYRVYPNGGAEEVVILERHPDVIPAPERPPKHIVKPNELVIFRNLAVPPLEFKEAIESSYIRHSLTRLFFVSNQKATSMEDLVQQLSKTTPPETNVRIMMYPRQLETVLGDQLPLDWQFHPVHYTHTLHAVMLSPGNIRYSLRPANETFLTAHDGPTRVKDQFCKAAGKLVEALHVTGFKPGNGAAIDVGAAPGGWTATLAQSLNVVAAVDPAELHPSVLELPNVVHIKKMSQNATEDIVAAIGGREVDLLVCDANKHPLEIVPMLAPLFDMVRSGGLIVLTLKFCGKGSKKNNSEVTTAQFGKDFTGVKYLWLLANTEHERTVVAVKK